MQHCHFLFTFNLTISSWKVGLESIQLSLTKREIDPFSYDCGLLQDFLILSAGFAEKSGAEVRPFSGTLMKMVFIIWNLHVLFYFSPLDWKQGFNFCPDCCHTSKNCRSCPSKAQDRGSVLSKRNIWQTYPSCKLALPWHPSAHFLVLPRVLFCP